MPQFPLGHQPQLKARAKYGWSERLTRSSPVDRSLVVIGGRSLRRGSLIERLYRDVAAGVLHNPSPDTVLRALGSPDLTGPGTFAR